jgi:hypothetical protein
VDPKVRPHDLRSYAESRTMPNALSGAAPGGQAAVDDSA